MATFQSMTTEQAEAVAKETGANPLIYGTLVCLSLSMLASSLGTSIANVALPTLAEAFQVSFQQIEWVVLAYLLAITSLVVSVGRLGDIVGRRRLLLIGLTVFTIASAGCGAASTVGMLIAARALQGIGAAVMMALTLALVSETVSKERVGSAMGLLGTLSAIGTALGPSLGGVLIAYLGWPSIFLVNVPIGLLAMLFAYRFLPVDAGTPDRERPRFDVLGSVLLAGSLAAYALSMTLGHREGEVSHSALLAAAVAGMVLFVFVETKVASPLIRLRAFQRPEFSAGLAANGLVATVIMTTFVVGPFYLSRALGLSTALVGLVMSVGPIISACTGVVAGRVVDRCGTPVMVVAGLVLLAVGAGALSALPMRFGVAGYLTAIAILTPGYQLFQAANNSAVMIDAPADQRGVMSGMLGLSRNLGLITGASVMGAVFSHAAQTHDVATASSQAVAVGMRFTFECLAILLVVAIGVVLGSRLLGMRLAKPEQAE